MFPPSERAARDFLWSDSGLSVSMAGRGLLSLGSRAPGPLLGPLLDGFSPLRAEFLPYSKITSILSSSGCWWVSRGWLVAAVAGSACLESHGSEERWCCRRNAEWERLQRGSYGYKPRFCFQKHKVFPPNFYQGSRNMKTQKFGSNWYHFLYPDFALPLSFLPCFPD